METETVPQARIINSYISLSINNYTQILFEKEVFMTILALIDKGVLNSD